MTDYSQPHKDNYFVNRGQTPFIKKLLCSRFMIGLREQAPFTFFVFCVN